MEEFRTAGVDADDALTFQHVPERSHGRVLVDEAQVVDVLAEADEVHEMAVVQAGEHLYLRQELALALSRLQAQFLHRGYYAPPDFRPEERGERGGKGGRATGLLVLLLGSFPVGEVGGEP